MDTLKTENCVFTYRNNVSDTVTITNLDGIGFFKVDINDLISFMGEVVKDKRIDDIKNSSGKDILGL